LPEEITSEHCYQLDTEDHAPYNNPMGWIWFKQLIVNEEMRVAWSDDGECPEDGFPDSDAISVYR